MFRNLSISTKLFLTFVPIFIAGIAVSVYLNNQSQEDQMQEQALESASEKAMIVRESLVNMMVESQEVNDKFLEKIRDVAKLNDLYIRIDTSRLHLAEDFIDSVRSVRLGERMQLADSKDQYDKQYGTLAFASGKQQWIRLGDNFRAMIPFKAEKKCQKCHDVQIGDILGVAHIEFPLTDIIEANQKNSQKAAMISGGFALFTILIGFIFYRVIVQKPLKNLEKAAEEIGNGNSIENFSLPSGKDEVGTLSRAFLQMQNQLQESQNTMRISTVGQVAASLVQDFRMPMQEIENAIEEIKKPELDITKKNNLLDNAKEAANLVNKMTQDLIDFTSGDLKVEKKLSSVGRLLRQVTTIVKPDLDKQQIKLETRSTYDGAANFDVDRTSRALDNIITYAANYIPPGGNITLQSDTDRDKIIFSITDNGSGIPKQFQEKIFEPFVKVVRGEGVGLDLALAKRIIEKQGGKISLQSEEGKGTTYTISIPM